MRSHPNRPCGHGACPNVARIRGYCQAHYEKLRRTGQLLPSPQAPALGPEQNVDAVLQAMVAQECALPWERKAR